MSKIKILKIKDLLKLYNPDGTLKDNINKMYISQSHFFIFVKTKEEYMAILKKCGFNIINIIGLYFEKWMCGTHCIYFRQS